MLLKYNNFYNKQGYNKQGYNKQGYNKQDYNKQDCIHINLLMMIYEKNE